MAVTLNNDGTLSIAAMSLVEFLPEIETAIHNGYMLDLEKNEGVPQQYGSMLVLTMYPAGDVVVSGLNAEVAGEEVEKSLEPAEKNEGVQDLPLSTNSEKATKVDKVVEAPVPEVKVDGRKRKA